MGYRSEVKLCVKKEVYEELKEKEELKSLMAYAEDVVELSKGVVVICWDWIKWYSDYEDISIVEATMDKLDEQNAPYKFVRIGEDWDDVDVRENWGAEGECDRISVYRGADIV